MTEDDTVIIDLLGMARPVRLVSRVEVNGEPHWHCLLDGIVPVLFSELLLRDQELHVTPEYEPLS